MTPVLALGAVPVIMAAGFESVWLALFAGVGLVWAAAIYVCSMAPMVAGRERNLNEAVAETLSIVAAVAATTGLFLMLLAALEA
jgi:hypothetical protein